MLEMLYWLPKKIGLRKLEKVEKIKESLITSWTNNLFK